ncbi:YchJ family metal-binding protein [Mycobacterium sp. NBC_00419]|uniref:YchJ family protein n=1 Tax=Mycobacterium sp. NBC_00419 TaxID=2975989 RepID=UPI002E1EAD83
MQPTDACPCGSGNAFGHCCLALHRGEHQAATAEQLMRARYSAYAVGNLDYVWQTWHPRTRPATLTPDGRLTWTGLQVLDTVGGQAQDQSGEVEFRAHYRSEDRTGSLHERSRFSVRARRWFYVDGDLVD